MGICAKPSLALGAGRRRLLVGPTCPSLRSEAVSPHSSALSAAGVPPPAVFFFAGAGFGAGRLSALAEHCA